MSQKLAGKVLLNMLWRFGERCGVQLVGFFVSLILARLLLPEQYGEVALITVITSVLAIFVESGFKQALIQKRDSDQLDFSTVFYFNIAMGVLLYLAMFFCAPAIARFYSNPYMTPYIRVLSLSLVLGGINGVQGAIVSKRMEFKKFFFATLGGTVLSAVVGVWMATKGFGVWALIAQQLTNQTMDTLILWFTVKWRPSPVFSARRLRPLFRFGSKLLLSALLNSATGNLSGLLVGKVYSAEQLSYFNKSEKIPNLLINNLGISVQSVLFPALATKQDQPQTVSRILQRSVKISSYVFFPILTGLALCAEPLIRILYTEKWISMVPYLQIWCAVYASYLLNAANLQVIQAMGRSDIFLKQEILKQALYFLILLAVIRISVLALMVSMIPVSLLSFLINAFPNGKLIGYGVRKQLRDLLPHALLTGLMGACVYAVGLLASSDILKLALQVPTGVLVYVLGSALFRLESFGYLNDLALSLLQRKTQSDPPQRSEQGEQHETSM